MAVEISIVKKGNANVVTCAGMIDSDSFDTLNTALKNLIKAGLNRIAINLSGITFMSSAGWGAILANLKEARQTGGDILLAAISREVRDVYKMAGFDNLIDSYVSVEKALKVFS